MRNFWKYNPGFIPLRGMKANEETPHEQGAESTRIGQYVRNWYRWAKAGIDVTIGDIKIEYLRPRYCPALPAFH